MKKNLTIGTVVDDGTGDYLRAGGQKINNNFDDLYYELGDGSNPHAAGAWKTIKSSETTTITPSFGKAYAINTDTARVSVKLPKGTTADYNKVIRLRDVFATWQVNPVTIFPASGDTIKGNAVSEEFKTNYQDLELVYCAPGRWEYAANKLVNKISNSDVATVARKEYLATAGQTDFLDVFDGKEYNLENTQVYHRGNLLYYGKNATADSDYGSPGTTAGSIVDLNGRDIRLRQPCNEGDSVIVVSFMDGIAQWRSTYNRLDLIVLDQNKTNLKSVFGSRKVVDLKTFNTITTEEMGYVESANTGLINPDTFEVYINGVFLNQAGTAGLPMFRCEGGYGDTLEDCIANNGMWQASNTDYSLVLGERGSIDAIKFDRQFEDGDTITIKWFNNEIGTLTSVEDIIAETDQLYISTTQVSVSGDIRVTDFNNPASPNVEPVAPYTVNVRYPNHIFDLIYPVGTIYENAVNPNNPATYLLGGTWKLWGEKVVTVGWTQDKTDTLFGLNNNDLDGFGNPKATAGGTGGERANVINGINLPATKTDEKVLIADNNGTVVIGGCRYDPEDEGPAFDKYREDYVYTNKAQTVPAELSNIQPYITVYRWMRIA